LTYQQKAGEKAKIDEAEFAKRLENPVMANYQQNKNDHWDMEGNLKGETERFKFEIKGLKRFNQKKDPEPQDEMACVEYVGIAGYPGWVRGLSDCIVFKRKKYAWLIVPTKSLWEMVEKKLKGRNYSPTSKEWWEESNPSTREAYAEYDRAFFGNKDKFCWVPYEDIEELKDVKKLEK